MSALPSSKKTHSEKHKQIFRQLLKEDANKQCADCKVSKNPRWASWSLGCFLCIRCSGIHRGMGTHISKVKSVDLDAWTDDQVENMIKWGNAKCNAFWESKLPANYVPDASKIENYIRTKYDLKKWAASTTVPDPLTMKVPTSSASTPKPSATSTTPTNSSAPPPAAPASRPAPTSANLLDDIFSSPAPAAPVQPQPQRSVTSAHRPSQPVQSAPTPPRPQSTGGSMGSMGSRPDLKKSILSLYSSPSASSSSFVQQQPAQSYSQPSQPMYQQTKAYSSSTINSVTSSLNGLNFSSPSQPSPSAPKPSAPVTPVAKPPANQQASWTNEWSDVPSGGWSSAAPAPAKPAVNLNGLDDDLFKNVWS